MGIQQEVNEGEARVIVSTREHKVLNLPTPYYCQNLECNKQIEPKKWKYKPKHCNRNCERRAAELKRGQCQRPGCQKYVRHMGQVYCSKQCQMAVIYVPRGQCQREGCGNRVKRAHAVYCSNTCRDACIDLNELSKKGQAVIQAHKRVTGRAPKYEKRSRAVSNNNRKAPPKRKMKREGMIGQYQAVYEPEGEYYRGSVPTIAGIIARGKTKKETEKALRKLLRENHVNLQKRKAQ